MKIQKEDVDFFKNIYRMRRSTECKCTHILEIKDTNYSKISIDIFNKIIHKIGDSDSIDNEEYIFY